MNPYAYRTTSLAFKALSAFSKARTTLHGKEHVPAGANIFVINHFTRIETLLLPYHIFRLTGRPVWSLADYTFFSGAMGGFLDRLGAVSTRNPHRDRLIVKSLLMGEAPWIIFPEGEMVKSKKIFDHGRFMISDSEGKHPPHTGAATLALRAEFYHQRLKTLAQHHPDEARHLLDRFQIESLDDVLKKSTRLVPVNITYYPMRAHVNLITRLARHLIEEIPERFLEEMMTEGTMLLSGVDIDIRFGPSISTAEHLQHPAIAKDISSLRRYDFDDPIPSLPQMRKAARNLMQRYMTTIYSMTTVNMDHLLAASLRKIPFSRIDPYDLRRRVFLTATQIRKSGCCYLHKNLQSEQVHLLADDRFGYFHDFVKIAVEKQLLLRKNKQLIKNRLKLEARSEFHRVRLENPIRVMANEVEPLARLQRTVFWNALLPRFWIKHQIVCHLLQTAEDTFERDYEHYALAGESKPKTIGRPFLLKGRSRKTGVLLIHGYMAAPTEVKGLAQFLARKGLWVYIPRLKGHGTSPEDLAQTSYQDWREAVDAGYAVVRNICRRVVVGGFSTGAGLALDLALRVEDICGVFAIAPPLRLQDLGARFVSALDAWNRLMRVFRIEEAKKEFVENNPENPHINYFRNPISGVREIERLMEALEPRLAQLKAPALVGQADKDPVVDPRGAKRVFELLGSAEKEYILFNFERHGILLGPGSQKVYQKIYDFILSIPP